MNTADLAAIMGGLIVNAQQSACLFEQGQKGSPLTAEEIKKTKEATHSEIINIMKAIALAGAVSREK